MEARVTKIIMTHDLADKVFSILVESCGANAKGREDFISQQMWGQPTEYRFIGELGFGGKLWNLNGKLYVSFYKEDTTPEREKMVEEANSKLKRLVEEYGMGMESHSRSL